MDMPARTLKAAIDFLALVNTGFCPAIAVRSLTRGSSSLLFWVASPKPMLRTIFSSLGTAIVFSMPSSFWSAFLISLLYFSFSLAAMFLRSLSSALGVDRPGDPYTVSEGPAGKTLRSRSGKILGSKPAFLAGPDFYSPPYFLVGSSEPHLLQILARLVPSVLKPTLAVPQLGQTSTTFEMLIGDSCSAMPPLVRCPDLLETVFLTTRTCSTSTVPLSGNTRSTRPVLPLSEPASTFTTSLRRIFKLGISISYSGQGSEIR